MTNPNDPAFPPDLTGIPEGSILDYIASQKGLTKREYFAATAITRLAAEHERRNTHWEADLAYNAIRVADAMIAELSK